VSAPSDPAGFAGWRAPVDLGWIDYNGHMTDWAYSVVCSQANEAFLEYLGVSADYQRRTGCTTYTVSSQLDYLAEVGPGQVLWSRSWLVDADAKRLKVRTDVFDDAGTRVLTAHYLFLHVDQAAGRVVPFAAPEAGRILAVRDEHAGGPPPQ
jgi:acyl-CoA thioesterase FadM